jgi:hypothetical protein
MSFRGEAGQDSALKANAVPGPTPSAKSGMLPGFAEFLPAAESPGRAGWGATR